MMSNFAQAFLFKKRPNTSIIQRGLYSSRLDKSGTCPFKEKHNEPFAYHMEQYSHGQLESSQNLNREVYLDYQMSVGDFSSTKSNHERNSRSGIFTRLCPTTSSLETKNNILSRPMKLPTSMVNRARVLMWSSSIETLSDCGDEHQNRERSRHKQNYSRFDEGRQFLFPLAALGVFKSFNADDIEDEKKKLTDEEKVNKMSPAELLIAKGVLKLCDLDYDKAEALFHDALHLAQKDENEEQETLVLNLLATNYFDSGRFEEAEKLYIDLIKRLIANDVEPSDPAILELSLKLSSIYSKNVKNHSKAFKGFEFVINSLLYSLQDLLKDLDNVDVMNLSEQQRNDLALLGWAYDWFARHLMAMNDYIGAVDMLKRALDISTKILGPIHDQTLILLNDVGTTLAMINSAEEGRIFIKRAVEGALESQSRELASFYVNLGLVNLQLRKLDEARRYCEYSIELASKNADHHNKSEILKLSNNCLEEVKRLLQVQSHQ